MKLWVLLVIGVILIACAGLLGGVIGIPWVSRLLFGVAGGTFAILLITRGKIKNNQSKRKS